MKQLSKRVLSLFLAAALLLGLAVPVSAVETDSTSQRLSFRETEGHSATSNLLEPVQEPEDRIRYSDTDRVRVSIVLEEKSTLDAGFSTLNIAENAQAMAYRQDLRRQQQTMTAKIGTAIGEELQVVWNLTLAANIISADVAYGELDTIRSLPGVREVVIEARYEPCVLDEELVADPNMSTSDEMIGTTAAWASGYTGAGSRIAVIDSGVDPDHQAFDGEALLYALGKQASLAQVDPDAFIESLDLLTAEEIEAKKELLHIQANTDQLYRSSKIPFGYNYADTSLDISHLNDSQGEHGSHVAGIATANAYLNNGDGTFTSVMDDVKVQGVAPDAQLIVMKVFGATRGGYESDYMVAIEDAIILGADAINLSLGSVYAGFTRNDTYAQILDSLVESDTVVSISMANNGAWPDEALHGAAGYLYADDVNMTTAGAPGTYTNSLAVASADNIGLTDYFLHIGEADITYSETDYDNAPIMTLVGQHEYIVLPGFGTEEEFEALGDVVKGKVVFCHRGENSFYQKGNAAVAHGAIATIVINNTTGVINMDLTDYEYTAPFVSITQANGQWIVDHSQAVTDGEGNVLYHTGKITITGKLDTTVFDQEYYTMSYFSSWGTPTSLEMKPEITAPGGNIYSVNGKHAVDGGYLGGSDQYENMSGTSMAAPQVAGMAALMAQYIRQNGLAEKTGLTVRALSQSLLMSTAVAMKEDADSYYPVLRQGSGLANVDAAIRAQSYLMMNADATDSWADGKVKAEMGDDPEKTGVYTFSFTLNNLTDSQKQYMLSAELFTQGLRSDENGVVYMDTETVALNSHVTWTVDGVELEPAADLTGMDFNGDSLVNTDDVQAILDYVAGIRGELINARCADLNGDSLITTYDAYLLLNQLSTGLVTLPAEGQVQVQVKAALTEEQKDALDANYPSGAYVQGYFFVDQLSTAEGAEGVTHSIPMVGFYGNWSEPSMFDKTSFVDAYYGDATVPYLGSTRINALSIKYYAFDFPIYLANDQGFYFLRNYEESDFWGYGDSSYSDQGAMAYVGQIYEKSYGTQHLFYVLSGHGSIYRIKIRPSDYKMRRDVLGKINMSFYDHKAMTMDYYNDGTNEGLIVGYSNAATGQAELYYINLVDDALTACKLGNIPGATAISGLTLASEQQYETHGITSEGSGVYKSSSQMLNVPFVPYLEPVKASELQNRADGALSSVTVHPASRETVTDSEQIVTVEVTARGVDGTDVAANNGLAIVTFDTEVLTLQDIQVGSDFRTVVEEDGSVLVAYADVSGYAAGEAVATLTFKVNETESTTVTVSHRQVNELVLDYTERLEVTFDHANTEIRDTKEATCTEAGYTGDVYCLDCGKLVKAGEVIPALGHSAGLVNMKEATCTEDGYTGDLVCTVCGEVLEKGEVIPASCPAERFTDVDTKQWYHEGVCYVLRKGFMVGKSETVFAADANLTRAELVLVLYRMAGQPSVEGMNHSFQDVPADQWYTDAVIWAYNEEIVNGISDTVFAPNRAVTREQIAAIMYRYDGSMKVEQNHLKSYTDADSISTYAVDAMNWAVANGIITGTAMTTLAPRESALRAQIAVIMMRYCESNS